MPATVFDKPIFPGAKEVHCQLTVTNTSGSYSHTEQDERITSAMSTIRIEVTDPSVFRDRISITTANGSYTISCAEVSGETAVKISFLKIVDDQQFVTSTEFDTLSNRIGDLDDLETEDQTSMVDAVNEVVGSVSSNSQAIANLMKKVRATDVIAGSTKTVSYPTGYTSENAFVLSKCFTNTADTEKYTSKDIDVSLTAAGIVITNNLSFNTHVDIILCKTIS